MASSSAYLPANGLCACTGKRSLGKEIHGRSFNSLPALPSLIKIHRTFSVTASSEQKISSDRRGFLKLVLGNAGLNLPGLIGTKGAYAADDQAVSNSRMSYSRFLEYLDKDRVQKVDLYENGTIAIVESISPELGNRIQKVRVQLPGLSQELLQKFREKNIDFAAHNAQEDSGNVLFNLIGNLAFPLILIGGLFFLSRRSSGGLGGPGGPGFPFAQSKAKFQMEPNTGVTFDDVAGVDEAKQDFMEVVEFLKKPERFTAVGASIPKGVLLIGPPGTGKTLLAKAIAGEAGVPFFSISGSEFVEMFVGVGASRVRDLFKKAKENAPCIVFVDEIDAVGRQRGTGIGGGNDEREQTLNQLLTEMDGFEGNTGIIVVAATNRADILDNALLRPGRFDRQVSVDVPDVRGRTEILKVHGSNKKFDSAVSFEVIAMRTPGFSGADLANLLNESAILAGRRGKNAISSKEIDDSIDRIVAGMEGTAMTDGKSKSLVAYHEVGHAICGTLTPGHDAVQKVTLIPRGQAKGLTWFIPSDDPTLISKKQLYARIVGGLGGRAAEEVIFGEPEVTTGAGGDLQQITGLAKQMVTTFGMSDIGPWSLMDSAGQSGDVIMRMMARNSMSEKLAEDIDVAVKKLSFFLAVAMEAMSLSSAHFNSQTLTLAPKHPNPLLLRRPKKLLAFPPTAIRAAINRTKKEETIATVKTQLENCYLLAGIKYKGFTVKQFQDLRRSLPETVSVVVAKNTLVEKAIEGTEWESLKPCMTGMNAWMFVHTEELPTALKPFRTFQKESKVKDGDFSGGVFEGKFYEPGEFKSLESMPTREEVYAKLLGSLQAPAMKLVGTLQAPARDLVFTLKAYVKKLEEGEASNA